VTSEMSSACPPEFIKAQAIAARSWMLVFLKNKHINEPFSICNDDCCQRYQGTTYLSEGIAQHIEETRGLCLVTNDGNICGAFYSKNCGGIMEKAQNIFGERAVGISAATDAPSNSPTFPFNPITEENAREWIMGDFLKKSDSFCSPNTCPEDQLPRFLGAVDEAGHYYRWEKEYSHNKLVLYLKTKARIRDIAEFVDFRTKWRGNSGRIHVLEVVYKDSRGNQKTHTINSQYQIRNALHDKFLFSSAFVWDYERNEHGKIKKVILHGAGWGHGVGLCQIGALGMALKGYSYMDILKHYYSTSSIVKVY
jgi:stage II sporulation protein D